MVVNTMVEGLKMAMVQINIRDLNHRSITSVTTQVYGNTESAAMEALRRMYRSWDNFVILEIEWKR
jgi:hypothetical protein